MPLPLRFRLERAMTDDELLRFCAANEGLRGERNQTGEFIVSTPTGAQSVGRNSDINIDLGMWASGDGRSKVFDSSRFILPDGSERSADAAWILYTRWNALSRDQKCGFAPLCPTLL